MSQTKIELKERVLQSLKKHNYTANEIQAKIGGDCNCIRRALNVLLREGRVLMIGKGNKGIKTWKYKSATPVEGFISQSGRIHGTQLTAPKPWLREEPKPKKEVTTIKRSSCDWHQVPRTDMSRGFGYVATDSRI